MFYAILASSAVLLILFSFITYHTARSLIYVTKEIWPAYLVLVPNIIYGVGFFLTHPFDFHSLLYIEAPSLVLIGWAIVFQLNPGRILNLIKKLTVELKSWPIYCEIFAVIMMCRFLVYVKPETATIGNWIGLVGAIWPIGYLIRKGRYRKAFRYE